MTDLEKNLNNNDIYTDYKVVTAEENSSSIPKNRFQKIKEGVSNVKNGIKKIYQDHVAEIDGYKTTVDEAKKLAEDAIKKAKAETAKATDIEKKWSECDKENRTLIGKINDREKKLQFEGNKYQKEITALQMLLVREREYSAAKSVIIDALRNDVVKLKKCQISEVDEGMLAWKEKFFESRHKNPDVKLTGTCVIPPVNAPVNVGSPVKTIFRRTVVSGKDKPKN